MARRSLFYEMNKNKKILCIRIKCVCITDNKNNTIMTQRLATMERYKLATTGSVVPELGMRLQRVIKKLSDERKNSDTKNKNKGSGNGQGLHKIYGRSGVYQTFFVNSNEIAITSYQN